MIAVIADDLTGAAELAGIGLRYGLKVEMSTLINPSPETELFVVSTDSRSTDEQSAVEIMHNLTRQLAALRPTFIYKKIDSVLRGHVLAELEAQLNVLGQEKVVVVAANPLLGRTIKNGEYYFQSQPIHQSSFAHDPEFPIRSSRITDMLRADDHQVYVKSVAEDIPGSGIIIGEVEGEHDLAGWAEYAAGMTFAAGASGFFNAILHKRLQTPAAVKPATVRFANPRLYVSGTTFQKSRDALQGLRSKGKPVSYMPDDLLNSTDFTPGMVESWANDIRYLVETSGYAIVAIESLPGGIPLAAANLRTKKAQAIARVLKLVRVKELIIEGGATAAAIIDEMGYASFFPVNELAPGVVRMRIGDTDMHMTVKPGSYQWPEGVWEMEKETA
ncbi:four-carbon acid sugar kinase family protein [Segetibacter sp. 3557_3]|uniref:four-carbon acid sugar kinase family protein n=1 Tax=Segetibacter sp. 3557_3 TaxID=2547429 RepID=UPI00105873AB|nr:four-carbon acid sugar kinase family protein [Segetibacter sp. 3557_3]TDH27478.1 four-carbon acid sugar kinase family protein [Segetibacter sp. 3557_3]